MLSVALFGVHLTTKLGVFYFTITNSNTISNKMMIISEDIKKSFFDILSPPSIQEKASPNY